MSFSKFFIRTCLIFLAVGPLVPLLAVGIKDLISTGSIEKLLSVFLFAPFAYIAAPIALAYGACFGIFAYAVTLFKQSLASAEIHVRIFFGLLLALIISLPLTLGNISNQYTNTSAKKYFIEANWQKRIMILERSQFIGEILAICWLYLLPSLVCGVIVAITLLPKLGATHHHKNR